MRQLCHVATWCLVLLSLNLRKWPPSQKPQKLRHMLSQYGEVGRLYLAPEGTVLLILTQDTAAHLWTHTAISVCCP